MLLLELPVDGWKRVFIVILAVVGNDTGGLLFGSLLGRHKLLPRVSPGKTWEGLAGGVLLGTGAATVAAYFMFDGAWYIGTVVGALATLAAAVGDLAESAIKRDMNIKDMSGAIPGHGGVLDRLDSMVFAAPVAYVAFAFFLGTL
jgi:phosphatidate cytidylyltransferase